MDEFDDNEISRLLRLKKYEQPPPGYFENFLHEFHRRQRDELLRQPLWKIAVGRAQDFMMSLNVARLASYPVAATAVRRIDMSAKPGERKAEPKVDVKVEAKAEPKVELKSEAKQPAPKAVPSAAWPGRRTDATAYGKAPGIHLGHDSCLSPIPFSQSPHRGQR